MPFLSDMKIHTQNLASQMSRAVICEAMIISGLNQTSSQAMSLEFSKAIKELHFTEADMQEIWFRPTLFGSPQIQNLAKYRVLDFLSRRGIYRSFNDLPEISECSVALLLIAQQPDSLLIKYLIHNVESGHWKPSCSDSIFLYLTDCNTFLEQQIADLSCYGIRFGDFLKFHRWLEPILGKSSAHLYKPSGEMCLEFYRLRAFRGIRRQYAREAGVGSGEAKQTTLPAWLDDSRPKLPNSFGALVVEWALATLRNWPDLSRQKDFRSPELHDACQLILTNCLPVFRRTEKGGILWLWLSEETLSLTGYTYQKLEDSNV